MGDTVLTNFNVSWEILIHTLIKTLTVAYNVKQTKPTLQVHSLQGII